MKKYKVIVEYKALFVSEYEDDSAEDAKMTAIMEAENLDRNDLKFIMEDIKTMEYPCDNCHYKKNGCPCKRLEVWNEFERTDEN